MFEEIRRINFHIGKPQVNSIIRLSIIVVTLILNGNDYFNRNKYIILSKMKKFLLNTMIGIILVSSLSSCATVFGGRVTQAQRTRPSEGEPSRKIRAVALIADIILFIPGLAVDFITGAIYKPDGNGVSKTPKTTSDNKSNTTQK